MGFHHGQQQRLISFQSGAMNSYASIIPSVSSSGMTTTAGMVVPNNPGMMNSSISIVSTVNSTGGLLVDNVFGVKHETGVTVDWSLEDQTKLVKGLDKYANEPSIVRYIKVAATLPDKTVRDVALRCRWMTKKESAKRRKPEGYLTWKKLKDRKDKLVDSSTANILPQPQMLNMVAYPFIMHPTGDNDDLSTEDLPVGSVTKHLLEENVKVFSQIAANLTAFRVQENIDLLRCARNNITAILMDMGKMQGIMSRMWPLPVSINIDLANCVLLESDQDLIFGGPNGTVSTSILVKQELI